MVLESVLVHSFTSGWPVFQHHLWKTLSFLHCIFLPLLLKIGVHRCIKIWNASRICVSSLHRYRSSFSICAAKASTSLSLVCCSASTPFLNGSPCHSLCWKYVLYPPPPHLPFFSLSPAKPAFFPSPSLLRFSLTFETELRSYVFGNAISSSH